MCPYICSVSVIFSPLIDLFILFSFNPLYSLCVSHSQILFPSSLSTLSPLNFCISQSFISHFLFYYHPLSLPSLIISYFSPLSSYFSSFISFFAFLLLPFLCVHLLRHLSFSLCLLVFRRFSPSPFPPGIPHFSPFIPF